MNLDTKTTPFSVLMSVYLNDDDVYLDQAMASILAQQTLKPTEVVLVIDGPISEKTTTIIAQHKANFPDILNVVPLAQNVGQGQALNKGLAECAHEYVARMDADDISVPDRFEKQIALLMRHPDVDISSGFVDEFNRHGQGQIRTVPLKMPEILKFSKSRSPVNHGACIYKKSKVIAAGGYSNFVQVQDYALFVNMICKGNIFMNQSDVLVRVRLYDQYARKAGLSYFREELMLAWRFYAIGHFGVFGLVRNIAVRAAPRLLGSRLVGLIYGKFLR